MTSFQMTAKNMTAIVISNALEWYDFVVYSFLTVIIAKLFFPSDHPANSILMATATFGVAFCIRPLGGIVMGVYADRKGRKAAITVVIAIMSAALMMISVAPTYAQAGLLAPVIIVIARMLQGFSAGGQFGVSTSLLIELAPTHQRGYYGSWQMVGQMVAMLLGAAVGMLMMNVLSIEQVEAYGWRIPFIAGLVIVPIGIYLSRYLHDTNVAAVRANEKKNHFLDDVKEHWKQILISMGLVVGGTVATYVNISYMPTYSVTYLHMSLNDAFTALAVAILVMVTFIPFFGGLSDTIGRKPILLSSLLVYLLVIYPLFAWLNVEPSLPKLMVVELSCCLLLSAYFGVFATVVAELFPVAIRSSGLGISYNITVMIFGGFAQFIVTWLIEKLQSPIAIVYYLATAIFISFVASIFYKDE